MGKETELKYSDPPLLLSLHKLSRSSYYVPALYQGGTHIPHDLQQLVLLPLWWELSQMGAKEWQVTICRTGRKVGWRD